MKKSMLLTTIAMIVVVVIALSTATFAWFSASGDTAIEGQMSIQAAKEYIFNTVNTTGDAWEPSSNTIDIASQLAAGNIAPVSPIRDFTAENDLYFKHNSVDAVPTDNGGKWYTVQGRQGNFSSLALNTDNLAVTHFQVAKGDGTAATATLEISIKTSEDTAFALEAVKATRVVLQITSSDNSGAPTTTQWVGTTFTFGGEGLVQKGASLGEDKVVEGEEYKTTATGAGQSASAQTLKSIATNTAHGLLTAQASYEVAKATGADIFKVNNTSVPAENGLYRYYAQDITFAASEIKTVTAYVWLDGHATKDQAAGKTIDLEIKIKDKAAA